MTDVENVKSRLDIVDVIGHYIELRPAGVNMKACCPFHGEKTPSFMVHRERQTFHCFGCGEGGDMFTFIQKQENVEFPEALRILAEKAGVTLTKRDPKVENEKTRIKDILELATKFYEQQLWADVGTSARDYLMNKRGLTEDTIRTFKIGFIPTGWDHFSKFIAQRGFTNNEIVQSGMVITRTGSSGYYDRFRERIMFPIMSSYGETIAFTGRLLPEREGDEKAGGKYVNSPETPVFYKSSVWYGLNVAKQSFRETKSAIIVEGQMDVIAAHQAGTHNVIASSGTAMTEDHVLVLKRHVDTLLFAFDSDSAGVTALKRALFIAWKHGLTTNVITLPEGVKDPGDYAKDEPAAWVNATKNATPAVLYFIERAKNTHDSNSTEGKRTIAQEILPLIKAYPDPIVRAEYIRTISDALGVDESYVTEALAKTTSSQDSRTPAPREVRVPHSSAQPVSRRESERSLELLLALIIKFPERAPTIIEHISDEWFTESPYKNLYNALKIWYNEPNQKNTPFTADKDGDLFHHISHLELLGEHEYGETTIHGAELEYMRIIKLYRTANIRQQLKHVEQQLKQAEQQSASQETIIQLTTQLNTLTKELRDLM